LNDLGGFVAIQKFERQLSGLVGNVYLTKMISALGVSLALGVCGVAQADEHEHHHHHHAEPVKTLSVSEAAYQMPAVGVTRMDGAKRDFDKELNVAGPVFLNFIYTSCTAICPMTTQVFASLQEKLVKDGAAVNIVSVSIDPEYDTPARLLAYAKKFGAAPGWQFYTGTVKSSIAIQKAFDAYRGDKMNHIAATFFRASQGSPWVRIEGMASSDELLGVYREKVKAK
jgi:protein SCO1/2